MSFLGFLFFAPLTAAPVLALLPAAAFAAWARSLKPRDARPLWTACVAWLVAFANELLIRRQFPEPIGAVIRIDLLLIAPVLWILSVRAVIVGARVARGEGGGSSTDAPASSTDERVALVGVVPELEGKTCDALLVEEYWHAGELSEPAMAVSLLVEGAWHRLVFDHAIVFWRPSDGPPEPYTMPELDAEVRVADHGRRLDLVPRRIVSVEHANIEHGVEVRFEFEGADSLAFRCERDQVSFAH